MNFMLFFIFMSFDVSLYLYKIRKRVIFLQNGCFFNISRCIFNIWTFFLTFSNSSTHSLIFLFFYLSCYIRCIEKPKLDPCRKKKIQLFSFHIDILVFAFSILTLFFLFTSAHTTPLKKASTIVILTF